MVNVYNFDNFVREGHVFHVQYCHSFMEHDYRWVLDWWLDLLDSVIQCVTRIYSMLLHARTQQTCIRSHAFTAIGW
jgi:hypothetical protein